MLVVLGRRTLSLRLPRVSTRMRAALDDAWQVLGAVLRAQAAGPHVVASPGADWRSWRGAVVDDVCERGRGPCEVRARSPPNPSAEHTIHVARCVSPGYILVHVHVA